MEKILLIIPAYNEEKSILQTCNNVFNYNKNNKVKYDILVINDGSNDNTKEILEENKIPHINLINNLGIGGAVQTGYKYAFDNNYDYAVQFDGDGQHNVEYIKDIVKYLQEGEADLVIGSRFISNISSFKSTKMRRVGIKIISSLIKLCTGKKITDPTSGFRAANKKCIEFFSNTYPLEYPEPESIVTLLKKKYNVLECPVEMNERIGGVSSIRTWKSVYYMINVCLSIIITSMKRDGDI